ncbi:hypothetical protein SCOCK_30423 [Actinacidiphila cocklensis]|uniref:Uncharacterized protein n=1 Tax=Actinacidiphila cocklensis TaxID=887465 RepID=A0A9W4DWH3_9ACTN|nr:hypothetical protein SCOCK_30423 [Actinacidiphila cocklensis]
MNSCEACPSLSRANPVTRAFHPFVGVPPAVRAPLPPPRRGQPLCPADRRPCTVVCDWSQPGGLCHHLHTRPLTRVAPRRRRLVRSMAPHC